MLLMEKKNAKESIKESKKKKKKTAKRIKELWIIVYEWWKI